MADRSSNGEYNKYQHDDDVDTKPRISLEKDDKDSQVDKAGEYVRELLQEKLELDTQKWPNALRLIDQGKNILSYFTIAIFKLFFITNQSFFL